MRVLNESKMRILKQYSTLVEHILIEKPKSKKMKKRSESYDVKKYV